MIHVVWNTRKSESLTLKLVTFDQILSFLEFGLRCIKLECEIFHLAKKKKNHSFYLFFNLLSSIFPKDFRCQTEHKFIYFAVEKFVLFPIFLYWKLNNVHQYLLTVCHLVYFLVIFLLKCVKWIISNCYFWVVYYYYYYFYFFKANVILCSNEPKSCIFS